MTSSTVTQEVMIATKDDITRLELSIKELTEVVKNVILLGERQSVQGKRIGDLEAETSVLGKSIEAVKEAANKEIAALEKKVDSWINRVVGGWFVIGVLAGIAGALLESRMIH